MLTPDQIAAKLAPHAAELREMGVASLALFGSVVRGEAREDSDIDLLVDFDRTPGLFKFVHVQDRIEEILGQKVDLVMRRALREEFREEVIGEAKALV